MPPGSSLVHPHYHRIILVEANAQDSAEEGQQHPISESFDSSSKQKQGKPATKSHFDLIDILAVLLSVLCLAGAVVIITPSSPYAFALGVDRQIVALGFILGIMNACLHRILPYLFILLECRYGSSTLQNYDGLLRWSPLISDLGVVWRCLLILLFILPLGLSISYKQFIGGYVSTFPKPSKSTYLPTGPPGLQGNTGSNQLMANTTIPFTSVSNDNVSLPEDLFTRPHTYGFNVILLSNTSAAAIDAPLPDRITALQQSMSSPASVIYLDATVRGTVAQYNHTLGDERYWNESYYPGFGVGTLSTFDGSYYAMVQAGVAANNDPILWNGSWSLIGAVKASVNQSIEEDVRESFLQRAVRVDVKRRSCRARWKLTYSSVQLVSGSCDPNDLDAEYQYYENCQLSLFDGLGRSLSDSLGSFWTTRNQSSWKIPTVVTVIASAYQTIPASAAGFVPIQPAGPIWNFWNVTGGFYEIYSSDEALKIQVPALKAEWMLYFVVTLQPILTVCAFCATTALFSTPISRTFGLVSIMAGVHTDTLDLLAGAAFSGNLRGKMGLKITVRDSPPSNPTAHSSSRHGGGKIDYLLGESGRAGKVRRGLVYE